MRKIKTIKIFIINFIKLLFIKNITQSNSNNMIFRGCRRSEIKAAEAVYKTLSGRGFSKLHKILLFFFSERFLFVALTGEAQNPKLVGLDFFYINYRDFKDKTIHEGYIGVLSSFEGRGIASQMRKQAIDHFTKTGFKGISSRISKSNIGSLRSAKKLGFKPVEVYFEEKIGEERYYLVKWFN